MNVLGNSLSSRCWEPRRFFSDLTPGLEVADAITGGKEDFLMLFAPFWALGALCRRSRGLAFSGTAGAPCSAMAAASSRCGFYLVIVVFGPCQRLIRTDDDCCDE